MYIYIRYSSVSRGEIAERVEFANNYCSPCDTCFLLLFLFFFRYQMHCIRPFHASSSARFSSRSMQQCAETVPFFLFPSISNEICWNSFVQFVGMEKFVSFEKFGSEIAKLFELLRHAIY